MYDIVIIGAGPAGLTASIYARRSNKKVLVLEAKSYGGQIVNVLEIDNYPVESHISGIDFATKLYNQAKETGAEIKFEKVIKVNDGDIKEVVTNKDTYKTKTVIIATGAENRKLGLENEKELLGKGVSYCATCDGPFYKKKIVSIIGGGEAAVEEAIYLSDIASKVYLIHRKKELREDIPFVNELLQKDNIEVINNSNIIKLNANDKLESIDVRNDDGTVKNIKVDALFVAVGRVPENENFANIVDTDKLGYIVASENCHTSASGIFVAGDTRVKSLRQLVTATSDGAIAATEAIKYINKKVF